jgi:predicted unusual protein kinase regulating ubiquinone biosynthesis (AarF/ABC1/UbiB family)
MYVAEKLFDMPSMLMAVITGNIADPSSVLCVSCESKGSSDTSANYVSSQMRLETSFRNEANNARRCAELLAQTPELRDDIYIPKVYGAAEGYAESDRIMVMEWVDGCR